MVKNLAPVFVSVFGKTNEGLRTTTEKMGNKSGGEDGGEVGSIKGIPTG